MSLPRPLLWLAGLLALYLAAPFLALFPQLPQADWSALDQGDLWRAAAISFASASLATALIGLGGVPLGYWLARRSDAAGRALGLLVQLPLALPPLASGVLLLFLLGPYSPLGRWGVALGMPLTDSFAGIVLAETFVAAPFLIVAARSAFAAADRSLEDVAASLGHGRASRFFKVALPQARPAIAAGLLLAWLRAMGEFGATVMVAYHPYSLPVFTYVSFGSAGLPAMLPILLPTLGAVLAVVASIAWLQHRPGRSSRAREAARRIAEAAEASPSSGGRTASRLDVHLRGRRGGFAFDVNWRSEARRIAIVGSSGAGKSLTLRLLAGLEQAAGADLRLNGQALQALPPERRRMAYVPQHYGLFPHLRVAEQLLFATDAQPAAAAYWARRLELLPLLERRPAELSSGQQQRVALARAMARPGQMILLDEPFAALDTPLRGQLRHLLRLVQEELAAITLLVTHDPQDAAQLADEIVVMAEGRVLQHGPAAALFRHPGSVQVARLLGIDNVFEALVEREGIRLLAEEGEGGLPLAPVRTGFAPGTRCLARIPAGAVSVAADGPLRATVEDSWSTPDGLRLALRIGDVLLQGKAPEGISPAVGSVVYVALDAAALEAWEPVPRANVEAP